MYLTAQRVRNQAGAEGVNAFYYVSGVDVWLPANLPPIVPDQDPGVLEHEVVTLAPPGNRVRSYLDIVAQDFTHAVDIRRAFAIAAATAQPNALPFALVVGPCWFRFNADIGYAHIWRHELGFLFEWAIVVYQQTFQP